MTNQEIEAFLSVVHWGSISRAAQALYITQPALTRRIQTLEQDLGHPVFNRQKGVRKIELTAEGESFLQIAGKWKQLLRETEAISAKSKRKVLTLSAIESVSSYIFPDVFREFLRADADRNLVFHNYHSVEAYRYAESGLIDLAFVSDRRYAQGVKIVPAFADRYVLAFGLRAGKESEGAISLSQLDPAREISLPWTDEFEQWHREHFDEKIHPYIYLEQMYLMEELLMDDTWAFVPESVARKLREKGYAIAESEETPPHRITYYLLRENMTEETMQLVEAFLRCMKENLSRSEVVLLS